MITAISNARPKIADYPFTTLHPNLGVVRVGPSQSFVVADVPGLIEGASQGAGLGHQFLRHLQRTRLLLHLVDMAPFDDAVDPAKQAKAIVAELKKYDPKLFAKPRWLVLNKMDMVPKDERAERVSKFLKAFKFNGPVFQVSALSKDGCDHLVKAVFEHIKSIQVAQAEPEYVDPRFVPGLELSALAIQEKTKTIKTAARAPSTKSSVSQTALAKPILDKVATPKTGVKKSASPKVVAKKVAAKKAPAKKLAVKSSGLKAAKPQSAQVKPSVGKKAPAKKAPAKKAPAKKTPIKKSTNPRGGRS